MKEKCPECKGTNIESIITEIDGTKVENLQCNGCGLIFNGMPILTTTEVSVRCPCCNENVKLICREITVGKIRKQHYIEKP